MSSRRLALALLAAALAAPTVAGEPPTLTIPVGQEAVLGGNGGLCDDLSVATITLDGRATVTAKKVGHTICSSRVNGVRLVYRVEVVKPPPLKDGERRK